VILQKKKMSREEVSRVGEILDQHKQVARLLGYDALEIQALCAKWQEVSETLKDHECPPESIDKIESSISEIRSILETFHLNPGLVTVCMRVIEIRNHLESTFPSGHQQYVNYLCGYAGLVILVDRLKIKYDPPTIAFAVSELDRIAEMCGVK
jgi:hypothetical protein